MFFRSTLRKFFRFPFFRQRFLFINNWVGGMLTNFFNISLKKLAFLRLSETSGLISTDSAFFFLRGYPTAAIVGSSLKDFSAIREINALDMPLA